MTDYEEPAAKISKLEEAAKDQEEDMDEGQEEWLSEGILTDDDYPAEDQDKSNVNANKSMSGDTTPSLPDDDPEDNSLLGDTQIQDNSFSLDNSQPEDNSNAQDNSIAQENLDAQDTSLSQDNLPIEENLKSKEYSHIDDISQAQLGTYAQFNSEVQNSSVAQDNTHSQDKSEAQKNLLSQVDSKTERNSNAQVKTQTQANSNAQNDSKAQNSHNDGTKVEPMSKDKTLDENIEQTLDNFENSRQSEIPAELGSFLIRKQVTDNKNADDKLDGSETDASSKHSDDGNDTDELLRMLGEDGKKGKKEEKTKKVEQKRARDSHSSDDDEFVFEGAKVARMKLAKTAISKKHPTKAVPETVSDREDESDASSDEGVTMKKMFVTRKTSNFAAKSTSKRLPVQDSAANVTKKLVPVHRRPAPAKRPVTSTPLPKLTSKPEITIKKIKAVKKEPPKKVQMPKIQMELKEEIKTKESAKPRIEPDEIIDEDGFLEEEDGFDLDEDFHSEPEKKAGQRIMKPEQMDEEVPTDGESQDDDDADSFYDELPSSESDQDDWFTLDVRSERAGDYIPLLGSKAHQFLTAEKNRVTSRLQSLRQNISALNESRRQQADMLRKATMQLAELDAALKA